MIEEDIKFLVSFSPIIPNYLSNLKKSINKKFILYNNIKDAILKPSLDLLYKAERKILLKKKFLNEVFDRNPKELCIEEEINELKKIGFHSVFFLYEKAPWYKSLAVTFLGIFEVAVGCLISSIPVLNAFSFPLINHGITNIGKGIEMFMNGKDFNSWKEFMDFEETSFIANICLIPLTLKKDDKKKYNFYEMELENDQDLREKILLNREKSFKEFFELNLQEMELDFKEEEKAIEKLKEDMIVLKEHVKNKIIEKVKNGNYFDNVFLIFDGDMEKIRHFIMNNINSQFLEYDISKEKDLDEKNLIEKISEKIKNKIDQIFEQNQEIKDKSLNKFKNEIININNEELKKIQTEQKKAHEENIIKANKEIDDIKKKGNNLKSDYENEINKNKENLKEKILNIQNEIN